MEAPLIPARPRGGPPGRSPWAQSRPPTQGGPGPAGCAGRCRDLSGAGPGCNSISGVLETEVSGTASPCGSGSGRGEQGPQLHPRGGAGAQLAAGLGLALQRLAIPADSRQVKGTPVLPRVPSGSCQVGHCGLCPQSPTGLPRGGRGGGARYPVLPSPTGEPWGALAQGHLAHLLCQGPGGGGRGGDYGPRGPQDEASVLPRWAPAEGLLGSPWWVCSGSSPRQCQPAVSTSLAHPSATLTEHMGPASCQGPPKQEPERSP